jgi:hypothetical protein
MILTVHVEDAPSYDVGPEIWQQPLADAIVAEAEMVADYAGPEVLEWFSDRGQLRERTIAEMTAALVHAGDTYRSRDGVLYSLSN